MAKEKMKLTPQNKETWTKLNKDFESLKNEANAKFAQKQIDEKQAAIDAATASNAEAEEKLKAIKRENLAKEILIASNDERIAARRKSIAQAKADEAKQKAEDAYVHDPDGYTEIPTDYSETDRDYLRIHHPDIAEGKIEIGKGITETDQKDIDAVLEREGRK